MKVLVKGDWSQAKIIFPKDADFITGDLGHIPPYDAAFLGHYLPTFKQHECVVYLKEIYPMLKNMGEIWVTVPSLEWAAREIVTKDNPSIITPFMIYGTEEEPYRCGFTLFWLRVVVQGAGFIVRKAVQEVYKIGVDDEKFDAVQNLVIGMKYDEGT